MLIRDGPTIGGRMAWVFLFAAGILEVVWAFFMKQSLGFTRLAPSLITLIAMIGSFALLSLAMRSLPLGTAYPIWTGIGGLGAFLVGVLVLGEAATPGRVLGITLITSGIILVKG